MTVQPPAAIHTCSIDESPTFSSLKITSDAATGIWATHTTKRMNECCGEHTTE